MRIKPALVNTVISGDALAERVPGALAARDVAVLQALPLVRARVSGRRRAALAICTLLAMTSLLVSSAATRADRWKRPTGPRAGGVELAILEMPTQPNTDRLARRVPVTLPVSGRNPFALTSEPPSHEPGRSRHSGLLGGDADSRPDLDSRGKPPAVLAGTAEDPITGTVLVLASPDVGPAFLPLHAVQIR